MDKKTKMSTRIYTAVLTIVFVFMSNVNAGPYVGMSSGQARADDYCDGFAGFVGVTCERTDDAYKMFIGKRLDKRFAVEVAYLDLGQFIARDNVATLAEEITGYNFSMLGIMPVSKSLDVYAMLGLVLWDLELSLDGTANNSLSEDGTDYSVGVGASYNLAKILSIRTDLELFHDIGKKETTGESTVTLISIGVAFNF